ncbi:MAG: methyltransferase domain-containing protein [Alphaproteobacteria bacterium]|nr:methyltransferase domain-containing protein [Alphaproteobacteria bacterium]
MSDTLRFLARMIARPVHTGAVAPSSKALGRAMAREVDPASDLPVLELGPGTGVVTEALLEHGIAPARLTAVEYDAGFAARVRQRCPGVRVIQGDAFDLDKTLGDLDKTLGARLPLAAAVSSLPLINFPVEMRLALLGSVFERLAPGAPFVQFSYRLKPPVAPPPGIAVRRAAVIWLNMPPARVWVYRRG